MTAEQLLERAAKEGTFESDDWPRVLEDILLRLDSIVHTEFPTPSLPPNNRLPPPPRLGSPISTLGERTSSQNSTASDKENAPMKPATARPPVPSFSQSAGQPSANANTNAASDKSSTYPPELETLHQSIRSTLKSSFPTHPPYSVQRLAELVLYPKKHYRFLPPYLNALDRTVSVSSNTSQFPLPIASLPTTGLLNGSTIPRENNAANALGSDESLGGALLTPIPWLSPNRDIQAQRVTSATNDRELQRESTEIVDGPNGAGRIETVSVVNGVMTTVYSNAPVPSQLPSTTSTPLVVPSSVSHSTEQTLRAEGAVTQGELLRQEQEAGVVPISPRRLRMSEEEMRIMDADEQEEDEKPHARGPEEIGMEDTGPQERPAGAGLDMEHAVGRHKRETSVERETSPEDVRQREEEMQDAAVDQAKEKESDEKAKEDGTPDDSTVIVNAGQAVSEGALDKLKPVTE